MKKNSKIYVAGHTGLVGSAILRGLRSEGHNTIIVRTRQELDLENQAAVEEFFNKEKPEYVFLAAAKVGGILANNNYPADFIYKNLIIEANVIHNAYKTGVKRMLFLGSSCIYPKFAPQPMREEYLLTGPLEPTNEPYAVAKIAGIKLCQAYNRQYDTKFLSVMPTNVYGPNDNYNLENSHVIPAMIRKFHLAKLAARGEWEKIQKDEVVYGKIPEDVASDLKALSGTSKDPETCPSPVGKGVFRLWGTGSPRRELLYVDDLADACIFMMCLEDTVFSRLLENDKTPLVNIGCGEDHTIEELANQVARIVGYTGDIAWDHEKPDGTPRKLLDIDRIKNLSWQQKVSLDQGIELAYKSYLAKYPQMDDTI